MSASSPLARLAGAVVAILVVVGAVGALPADAKAGDVRVAGTCNRAAKTKIKLAPRDGRIEVEFEVDSNRNGQRWSVRMRQNGALVHNGAAVTRAPSGSFTVRRSLPNRAGTDTITAVGRNAATGQSCTVTARV
ncbi:MAG: hypothetical protein KDA98_04280 [Acidimicrobiales bacterium]|nr:hypothetical protein [Acidimicrobiales bacterium]